MRTQTLTSALIFSLILPLIAQAAGPQEGAAAARFASGQTFEQEFTLTAYYSPLPEQCCYVKGSFEEDVILNGKGTNGADGTAVYPGMIAAPSSYPFGTRIQLPGLGTFTVHDRGGAIQEQEKSHRLDVWAGKGEEGLARALMFGVVRLRGTVYPPGSEQPAESFALESLPAPVESLAPFMAAGISLMSISPTLGDRGLSVQLLQEKLQQTGYFSEAITGFFGPVTQESLQKFQSDMGISEPTDTLTEITAASLEALAKRVGGRDPIPAEVDRSSAPAAVASLQRTLRYLGFYKGRTNSIFDDTLRGAVISFQQAQALVGGPDSPGAGRVGPKTHGRIMALWKQNIVKKDVDLLLAMRRIDRLLAEGEQGIVSFLGRGEQGKRVHALQSFLADRGLFEREDINGVFGPATEQAVIAYQLGAEIIKKESDTGAGYVGPQTLLTIRREQRNRLYKLVRAEGWEAL